MADIYIGEDLSHDMSLDFKSSIRIGVIDKIYLDASSDDQNSYGTMDIRFIDLGGVQKKIRIPYKHLSKSSGEIDFPEKDDGVLCTFLQSGRSVVLQTFSTGLQVGSNPSDRTNFNLLDFVNNGILPQMNEGEHVKWTGNGSQTTGSFSFIRKCARKITQTIGTLLDATKNAILIDGKNVDYQVGHSSGLTFSFDQDGNILFNIPAGKKIFVNKVGSSATDDDAIITRKFLTDAIQQWTYPNHLHIDSLGGPTTPIVVPVPVVMPDGVSTPDVRMKGA